MLIFVIVIVSLIAILLGRRLSKYASDILVAIIYVGMCIFLFPLHIYMFLIRGYNILRAICMPQSKIIRWYDRIFCECDTVERVGKINRKIRNLEDVIECKQIKKIEKMSIRTLENSKWVI